MSSDYQALPSISDLFKESWDLTKKLAGRLLLFQVASFFLLLVLFLGLALIFAFLVEMLDYATGWMLTVGEGLAIAGVFALGLSLTVGMMIMFSVMPILIVESKEKVGFLDTLNASLRLIPKILLTIILTIPWWGAWGFFIIPGFIISFYTGFMIYEAIFENHKTPWAMVKRSIAIWQYHGHNLFARCMAIYMLGFFVNQGMTLVAKVLEKAGVDNLTVIIGVGLVQGIISLILMYLTLIYMVRLYRYASQTVPVTATATIWWMWVVSIFGWIILVVTMGSLIAFWGTQISNYVKEEEFTEQVETSQPELIEATRLTQTQADILAADIFTVMNQEREASDRKTLIKDQKICEYADQQLAHFTELGMYDDGAKYQQDIKDPKMLQKYFVRYEGGSESLLMSPTNLDTGESAVLSLREGAGEGEPTYLLPDLTAGCIRANPEFVVIYLMN